MPPGIWPVRDSRTDSASNWRMTSICSSQSRSSRGDGCGPTSSVAPASSVTAGAAASLTISFPGPGAHRAELAVERVEHFGCVVSVEVAVVHVERRGKGGPHRETAVDGHRPPAIVAGRQQQLLPGRDDPSERVHTA